MPKSISNIIASQKQPAPKKWENPQNLSGIPLPNQINTPAQPDENPDPTKPGPGGNEPDKNDPPHFIDPPPPQPEQPEYL